MGRPFLISLAVVACALLSACGDGEGDGEGGGGGDVTGQLLPDVAAAVGLTYSVDRAEVEDWFMPESMTCGCALFDADGDGDLDAYVVNGWRAADGSIDAVRGRNVLWLQRSDGSFQRKDDSGLADGGYGMGVAVGDVDNDGDLDVFVTNWGPDRLFRNDGNARFTDVTEESGIAGPHWGASAGFCDVDGDGWLDLFVTNYVDYDPKRDVGLDAARRPEYPGPERLKGVSDQIYRGVGLGRFEDWSGRWGVSAKRGRGLGLAFLDLDGDARLDVYVANDREPNHAWIWKPGGGFEERALRLNIGYNERGAPEASMGVGVGDTDGDGRLDILLTHLVTETHTLYRQTKNGSWRDVTSKVGLGASTRNDTGWGCAFVDLEHDGDLDLLCVNGRVMRGPVLPGAASSAFWNAYAQPDRVFVNDGGRFTVGRGYGAFDSLVENGRGLAVGDVDGDGDPDFLVSTANGTLRLFRNDVPKRGHWIGVRTVESDRGGRDVEGAVVTVTAGGRSWTAPVGRVGSYLSSSEPVARIGIGSAVSVDEISVHWPGGAVERFGAHAPGTVVRAARGQGR